MKKVVTITSVVLAITLVSLSVIKPTIKEQADYNVTPNKVNKNTTQEKQVVKEEQEEVKQAVKEETPVVEEQKVETKKEETKKVENTTPSTVTPVVEEPKVVEETPQVLETVISGDTVTVYRDYFKSYQIWFAEFKCDEARCEGFNQHGVPGRAPSVIESRRGDIESVTMKAPQAKTGYQFVEWRAYTTTIQGVEIRGYEAIYQEI